MEFIDLKKQYQHMKEEVDEAIESILAQSNFIMGSEVNALEQELASYVGTSYCISCGNGTDALQMCLMALDIQPGDEVITSPFSYISSADVISLLGATPVFADIHPQTFNLDPEKVKEKITSKTKAIIPVSLFGHMPDIEAFQYLSQEYQLPLIEDGAQSFGACYQGRKSGSVFTLSTTSFFPAKPLGTYGDGGAIFTRDEVLAKRLQAIRLHGGKRHDYRVQGINSRLDTLQAAILRVKLKHFDSELLKRKEVANYYNEKLSSSLISPTVARGHESAYALYTIRVPQSSREAYCQHLKEANIPHGIYYPRLIPHQIMYQHLSCYEESFLHAEKAACEVLSLPMHPYLDKEEQDQVLEAVNSVKLMERV